jgi:hypothetical protein
MKRLNKTMKPKQPIALQVGGRKMDGFRISLAYGCHQIAEGQKRLKSE